MANIFLDGQQNLAALSVPGVYGDIILPQPFLVGSPANIMGLVGVASWGPVNSLVPVTAVIDGSLQLGPAKVRSHDIMSYVTAATQVGGSIGFLCVRVTDGTDVAATGAVQTTGLTLTAKYTGTAGNNIKFSIQNGSAAGSFMLIVQFPGLPPEQFNNISGTGNAFWINAANAINNGTVDHGPSNFVVATAGALTAAPTVSAPVTLSGGTDGDATITDAILMGQDTLPRKFMYVFRNSLVDSFTLCDLSTTADYAAIGSFAIGETMLPVFGTTSGDSAADAITIRETSGIDTPWFWLMVGDYPTFYDAYNGVSRLINPTPAGTHISPLSGFHAVSASGAGTHCGGPPNTLLNASSVASSP